MVQVVSRDDRESPRTVWPRLLRFVALVLLLAHSPRLFAHDPPEEYFDRNLTIRLEAACVRVVYRLEVSQVSLFNLPRLDERIKVSVPGRAGLEAASMDRFKVLVPDRLVAFLNGKPLAWDVEKTSIRQEGSTHFRLDLRADWKPLSEENALEILDMNFKEQPGPYRMKVDLSESVNVTLIEEPKEWTDKGVDPASEHKALANFRTSGGSVDRPSRSTPDVEAPPAASSPSVWERLNRDDLVALLSTEYGLWLLMLIALIHGAGHSLMPGHGKTMVAAYLIGERGTPWHAVLLGIVTTLTHTSAAIAIALLIRYVLPQGSADDVNKVLLFVGGLLMAGIGIWLFLQRLAGRSDHVHLFNHGHSHSHDHDEEPAPAQAGVVRLILLGIAGGIIPCWGAVMWVIGCIATSQFWLALPVVLAFSVGLATVLIVIGLSVVYAGRFGNKRWSSKPWFRTIFNERTLRWLPVFGAAVVVALGLFLCATSGIAGH